MNPSDILRSWGGAAEGPKHEQGGTASEPPCASSLPTEAGLTEYWEDVAGVARQVIENLQGRADSAEAIRDEARRLCSRHPRTKSPALARLSLAASANADAGISNLGIDDLFPTGDPLDRTSFWAVLCASALLEDVVALIEGRGRPPAAPLSQTHRAA